MFPGQALGRGQRGPPDPAEVPGQPAALHQGQLAAEPHRATGVPLAPTRVCGLHTDKIKNIFLTLILTVISSRL